MANILKRVFFYLIGHHDCQECGAVFSGHNAVRCLSRHIKVKHTVKIAKTQVCEFCNVDYKFPANLQRHYKTCKIKKKKKSRICEFCDKDYKFKSDLHRHYKTCRFRKSDKMIKNEEFTEEAEMEEEEEF